MKFLFSILFFLSFSIPAFSAESRGDCFSKTAVSSFESHSPTELSVRSFRDYYQLQVSYCSELPWAQRIAFDSFSNRVCAGDRVLVLDNFSNRVIQSCYIFDITKN